MNPDPKTIVAKLGEGQRRALKVLSTEYKIPPRGHAYWAGTMFHTHRAARLTEYAYAANGSGKRLYRLTPLGLEVRALLTSDQVTDTLDTGK